MHPLSLYVHLPFCANACYYCGRNKVITKDRGRALPYLERLEKEIAVSPEVMAALTDRLGEGSRLVVYCPYPEPIFVNLVRQQYERLKNLLYPEPRDVRFAVSPEELGRWIEARFENKLVVLDGTQEAVSLPVPGEFDLMTEQAVGAGGRLRYWLLRRAGS